MVVDTLSMKRAINGEVRLTDPVDDAILTLGVRVHNPLSYKDIASLFGISRDDVSEICEPYKEFLRTAGEEGPALVYGGHSFREAVRPRAMWENALFGNSGRESFQKQQIINGADRLADPVDDTILTLGLRMHNSISYEEIAALFDDMDRKDVSKICEPYKEFMRKAGEYGVRGVTRTG